jgi:hypothetical protein
LLSAPLEKRGLRGHRFFSPFAATAGRLALRCKRADAINIVVAARVSCYKRLIELLVVRADAL